MRKVNMFAVIGLFFFNLIVMLAAVITVYALLGSAWIVFLSFIASPALVVGAAVTGLQAMTVLNLGLSIVLAAVAFFSLPLLKRLTSIILTLTKHYIEFNRDAIYY